MYRIQETKEETLSTFTFNVINPSGEAKNIDVMFENNKYQSINMNGLINDDFEGKEGFQKLTFLSELMLKIKDIQSALNSREAD